MQNLLQKQLLSKLPPDIVFYACAVRAICYSVWSQQVQRIFACFQFGNTAQSWIYIGSSLVTIYNNFLLVCKGKFW